MIAKLTLLAGLFLISLPLNADTQFYRWLDEKGEVHFSDKAPTTSPLSLEKIKLEKHHINSMQSTPVIKSLPNPPQQSYQSRKTKHAINKAKTNTLQKKCDGYQSRLRQLRSKMRLGYSAKQAPKLLRQERAIKDAYFEYCK